MPVKGSIISSVCPVEASTKLFNSSFIVANGIVNSPFSSTSSEHSLIRKSKLFNKSIILAKVAPIITAVTVSIFTTMPATSNLRLIPAKESAIKPEGLAMGANLRILKAILNPKIRADVIFKTLEIVLTILYILFNCLTN